MKEDRKTVVGAVTIKDNKLLAFKRPLNKENPGLWEFVGGKVEDGETDQEALVRECREEIGCTVSPQELIYTANHDYPFIKIQLKLYKTELNDKDIRLKEHLEFSWIPIEDLNQYSFCPADEPFLSLLKENNVESL